MTTQKKSTKRGQRAPSASRPRPSKRRPAATVPAIRPGRREVEKPAPAGIATPPVSLSVPEREMAARVPPPEPDRPVPSGRRAIFFDVENSSRADHVERVLAHLAVDRATRRTELIAVGNWKVIGQDTARLLARKGAALVHSAPSTGVRDWSDLRIAIGAGVWLASARAGDVIEIVSDDRAFDAVGDVAASLGIDYRRLSFRSLAGMAREEVVAPAAAPERHLRRRRRGRRRGGSRRPMSAAPVPSASPAPSVPPALVARAGGGNGAAPPSPAGEPHTAPADEIVSVVRGLIESSPGRAVTIDALANTLKARGFSRPPGSPRLITRLRRIRQIEVSRTGMITLVAGAEFEPAPAPEPPESDAVSAQTDRSGAAEEASETRPEADGPRRGRRRSRRGGRRHRRGPRPVEAAAGQAS